MAKVAKKKAEKPVQKSGSGKKSWQEKLHPDREAEIEVTTKKFADIPSGSSMLIATPLIVDQYIRQIPRGHFSDIRQIRKDLAAEYHAQYTCPISTGIFVRIVAEAAFEEYENGKALAQITPFWRALSAKSPSAKKLSFGMNFLLEQQRKEGIIP
ncbi:MAG TPA: hypothetical protein PLO99_04035 [Chitinophagaceae bacterium]|nr:hypothetical protein [Chitinophagaceae bacterium]HRG92758.1 hypothetical protein [Chitinophagaceae bacterium]